MATTTVDPTEVFPEDLNQNSTNYDSWRLAVENYLRSKGLWVVVEGHETYKKRQHDDRALQIIRKCCGPCSNFICEAHTAKDALDTLEKKLKPDFFDITDTEHNVHDCEHEYTKKFLNDKIDWRNVMEFIDKNPDALRVKIPKNERIALHIAVLNKEMLIVEQLVGLMKEEDLEIRDKSGFTAFYYAVHSDNHQMVKCMVEKNKKLLSSGFTSPSGVLPVLWAYAGYRWEMALYLYHNTPLNALKGRSGAELISQSLTKKKYEIGWDLIHRCPSLALTRDCFGHSPLNALAGMQCAFRISRKQLNFWKQWIYNSISIESLTTDVPNDVRINVRQEETNEENQRNSNLTGISSFGQLATSLLGRLVLGQQYKNIREMKLVHFQCRLFLRFMCKEVAKNKINLNETQRRFVQSAIFRAVEQGHIEFIDQFVKEYPDCMEMTDAKGMNMFQYAVECRQEKVYNKLHCLKGRDYRLKWREIRKFMDSVDDDSKNSVLHLVGRLPSYGQLDRIKDAALRMQRELQWFKEVESIVPRSAGDLMNITDSMTPRELFTKNHKELKKEAEKSMKNTATSCTVVGTLIITMMFAAAFTVPGGKNGETGIPKLLYKKLVTVYLVSDAISLCSSSTSVIIFLGILTSRYAEDDFLRSLPTKMIFGILNLFLAIASMMIAFSCAIYIMFEGKTRTCIPVISLGAIPVISFVLMKFYLLKDMVVSTYGAGIFDHPKEEEVEPWESSS